MDERTVFSKTAKGIAEVAQRSGGLSLAARRVLIMIDGKRTVRDLAPLLKPGEIDGVLGTLEAQDYIERGGAAAEEEAIEPPTTVVEIPPEERTLLTLDEAKRRASRELIDRLGPDGETMAMRIENARNADELKERVREAERLVAGYLGEAAAQDYMRALRRR